MGEGWLPGTGQELQGPTLGPAFQVFVLDSALHASRYGELSSWRHGISPMVRHPLLESERESELVFLPIPLPSWFSKVSRKWQTGKFWVAWM